jgi:DNA (cytosine-5)-methyltransferase 1
MRIKVFDFFSGCGGTSAGLRSAGMDIVLGIDSDADAAATYKANFPEAGFLSADLTKTRSNKLKSYVDSCKGHATLFCGCAPCQPFSKQNGSRDEKDSRSSLLSHFGRFVRYYKPDFILVENVPGIQNVTEHCSPLGDFVRLLEKLKYRHIVNVVDCRDYGVPQTRKRLVLIASRVGPLSFPEKTHGEGTNLPYSTVWQWIKSFPRIMAGQECKTVANHRAAKLSKENLRRIRATPPGGSRSDWPRKLMLDCHKNGHDGHSDVYGRLRKDQPASALTTRCISLSNGRFGHPTQHRAISAREAATLQTFERTFIFKGTLTSTARQIGNAVPVLLAKRLGESFLKHSIVRKSRNGHV